MVKTQKYVVQSPRNAEGKKFKMWINGALPKDIYFNRIPNKGIINSLWCAPAASDIPAVINPWHAADERPNAFPQKDDRCDRSWRIRHTGKLQFLTSILLSKIQYRKPITASSMATPTRCSSKLRGLIRHAATDGSQVIWWSSRETSCS